MLIKIGSAYVDPAEIAAIEPARDDSLPDYERARQIYVALKSGPSFWVDATMDEAEAALIDAGVIENPYPDAEDEPPELTENERSELAALDANGYEYIARDADGKLYAYKCEPGRADGYYFARGASEAEKVEGAFDCVDFGEAWRIAFLLCE